MSSSSLIELREWFAQPGSEIKTRQISAERIGELEGRYSIVLPDDFKQYLSLLSPAAESMDRETTAWWQYERIKSISDEFNGELNDFVAARKDRFLVFADYCIWCWAWAISCANDDTYGKVALIGGRGYDRFVADSFSDFVRKYISDFKSVS